ncbi:MAG TPA: hypothetical protein VK542_04380, partial [Gemmatimonadaceae bacterium]|nr:hypothetical protein [Gemmatimonadaceae bacterium]
SSDTISGPDPSLNPEEYNKICQRNTSAPHCSVPLYWAAPNRALSSHEGMHRFSWDMRFDPIDGTSPSDGGAVPHRTYLVINTPWAPPGAYTVRLVADGKTYAQPLRLVLDPRVKTSAAAMTQVTALSREMYDGAVALRAAYVTARAKSDRLTSASAAVLKSQIDSIAPPPARGARPGFGFRQAPSGPPTLVSVGAAMMAAAMAMQNADVAPTAREVDAVTKAREQYKDVLARWSALAKRGSQ